MMWDVIAIYESGRRYVFKTKDLIRTLRKLMNYEELVSVAIKANIKSNAIGAWVWIEKEYIQFLLEGVDVPITWTLQPTLQGVAWGSGSTNLRLLGVRSDERDK